MPVPGLAGEQARVVYKSNGGVFMERPGGVWAESNSDGGSLLFHWGVVRETPDQIILQDASRGLVGYGRCFCLSHSHFCSFSG